MLAREFRRVSVAMVGLLLAACTTGSPGATGAESEMPMGSGEMGMEMDAGALGAAADEANADRTVAIVATDELVFDPDTVDVQAGETITFEIENTGSVDHEFVIGSEAWQAEHEEEMQADGMEMGEEPNEVEVPAGETVSLTWQFTEAGTTQFGCHVPGHFPAGMVGTITVSE
jgi:uncharacterized cupredoxin-like copper-binding protein